MRDKFKFRAWDKVEEQMLSVGLWDMHDATFYNLRNANFERSYSTGFERHNADPNCRVWGNPDDLIIMLYSDEVDVNGDRLCDGDLVRYEDEIYQIVYDESCFFIVGDILKIPLCEVYTHELELCGNLYENPDMI